MKTITSKVCSISIIFILSSCTIKNNELKNSWWKYTDGFYFGDALDLKKSKIINDTIINNGKVFAVITSKRKNLLFDDYKIVLKDINSGKKGLYTQK